jgi:hypothetical protein
VAALAAQPGNAFGKITPSTNTIPRGFQKRLNSADALRLTVSVMPISSLSP